MTDRTDAGTTGVLTFLFSDIEGSSRRWESAPSAMREAVRLQDETIERAVTANGGRVFKRVGDENCCVFLHASAAVKAAVEVQRAIGSLEWPANLEPLRVRMAVHSGDACVESNGDYSGSTLNRIARLTATAHGGQIILSTAAAALTRERLPPQMQLQNLGTHRLRDLALPETIYQLTVADLPAEFPTLKTLDARPNNLPSQISSFVGRARELKIVLDELTSQRLVTIAGPGGIGKTRLSLQAAAEALTRYEDGCYFIRLADVQDPALVPATIAATLDVKEESGRPVEETLFSHLRHKQMLLILDNSEHLLSAVATIVAHLSERCACVSFLLTSREPTHVTGERVVRLNPLSAEDAKELFLQRAQYRSNSTDSDDERELIAAICRTVDAIPLGIELAAARSQSLSARELAEALRAHPALLASRDPAGSERHRTLAATIEWSFRLLDSDERRALTRLSIFEGGFTNEAAEAVVDQPAESMPFIALLDSLVDKSLVNAAASGGESRYRILDPIRQFLADKLRADGAYREPAARHCWFFEELAHRWYDESADCKPRTESVETEMPNLRAALNWAWNEPDRDRAVRFLISLVAFWQLRGAVGEGRAWLTRALQSTDLAPEARAALLRRAATFATKQDDYQTARMYANESLAICRSLPDVRGTAEALHALAVLEHYTGNLDAAFDLYGQALEAFRESAHSHGRVAAATNRAMILSARGQIAEARRLFEESSALCRAERRADDLASVLNHYATLERDNENVEEADRLYVEALNLKRETGSTVDVPDILANLAILRVRAGRLDEAFDYAREELGIALKEDAKALIVPAMEIFSILFYHTGKVKRAAELLAIADQLRAESNYSVDSPEPELAAIRSENEYAPSSALGSSWRNAAEALLPAPLPDVAQT